MLQNGRNWNQAQIWQLNFHKRKTEPKTEPLMEGKTKPAKNQRVLLFGCGAGGNWTLVQTGKSCAFYTLIPDLFFVCRQDLDHRPAPYPLWASPHVRGRVRLSPILLHHFARALQGVSLWVMSRLSTLCRDKLIYYTSIKQRERNEFRQIIVERPGIKESDQRLSACLRNTPSCCQIHVSPMGA